MLGEIIIKLNEMSFEVEPYLNGEIGKVEIIEIKEKIDENTEKAKKLINRISTVTDLQKQFSAAEVC